MDGDFFKSLAKKPATKFDVLLARAAKYMNMEDAQASKREGRGEKRKENKDENPFKKPKMDFKDKKPTWQRVNTVYTPLTVPITQALMAVEGKGLLSRPRSYKDEPRQPKLDKFCRFHNDYGHTTEECRHLKSEIERLIQNGYLQDHVCLEKARGTGPYQKYETNKGKEVKNPSPGSPVKDMPKTPMTGKAEVNDPPRKGVIRMIAGGPATGDSQRAGKAQEQNGPRIPGNDALVITTLLANYETERVFIDSGSSADILFGEAYDQIQMGDVPLEAVDTSLYRFAGEVVHPRGMISLPLTLGTSPLRKTCLLKFLVVDIPSAYNVILGRPTLNAFWAILSTYHMKIKFLVVGGVGEAQADILQVRKWYVEAIKRGKKRILEEASGEENPRKRGKDPMPRPELKEETPITVQSAEELLTVELIPGDPNKVTKIGSKMKEDARKQVIDCLRTNKDIFA
ncbi:UNVERIFIED_CONTAM: hypothetical protein Slati_2172500 [Sesamum latifolium]|uniref:Reverse transcriptase domain-containing protein n=1 Tax=Sesamum latifolium TaxID=2727402 RepID=A0AAW2WSW8_9LAMI